MLDYYESVGQVLAFHVNWLRSRGYHERKDETRNVGLGPEHDWSSHAVDALGLMAICYEEPGRAGNFNRAIRYAEQGWV